MLTHQDLADCVLEAVQTTPFRVVTITVVLWDEMFPMRTWTNLSCLKFRRAAEMQRRQQENGNMG